MSTIIEEATEGLREARNSLGRAEEELREWKAANQPLNTLHPTYHCFHIFLPSVKKGVNPPLLAM
jgi:hypothetical protein